MFAEFVTTYIFLKSLVICPTYLSAGESNYFLASGHQVHI